MDATPQLSQSFNPDTLSVKGTLLLTSTLIVMASAVLTPSLPAMEHHFSQVENAEFLVKLVLTIPSVFIVIGAPAVGFMIDSIGRKIVLIVAIILFSLLGVSGYFIASLTGILISRALLGLATAGVVTTVTTLIADYFSGQMRARLLGLQAAFIGIGAVSALLLGGFLADLDWRNPFLIHAVGFVILGPIVFVLREPDNRSKQELATAPTLSPSDLDDQENSPEKSPFKLLGVSVFLLLFIYGIALLAEILLYLVPVHMPFYLESLTGASATENSFTIAAFIGTFIIGSLLFVRLRQTLSYVEVLVIAFALLSFSYEVVGLSGSYWIILAALAIGGLGAGFIVPNLDAWLTAVVPADYRGRALGGLTGSTFMGQFLSPIVTQPVIDQFSPSKGYAMIYVVSGWVMTILVIAIALGQQVDSQQKRYFS